MGSKPPSFAAVATALLFALSCFCATLFVWKAFGGTSPFQAQGYRFHALFGTDATNLASNSSVRIAGVPVGRVVKVDPKDGRFDATIELKKRYAPIPVDSRATTRIKTLLGETFVELTPGSPTAPKLREGGSLKRANIGEPQGIDQVLGAFDAKTRAEFKDFLNDLGTGLKGRGQDLNAILGNATPAAQELNRLVQTLDAEQPAVKALIRDSGDALNAIADRTDDTRSLIRSGNTLFAATAARNRELTDTVKALPPFLREGQRTFTELQSAADEARPVLRTLRPVAPLVRPALSEASKLAPQLTGTFKETGPVLNAADRGLPALTRTLKVARPLVDVLEDAGRDLVPVVQYVNLHRNDLVTSMANLGAATQAKDPVGQHYLRTILPIGSELLAGQTSRQGTHRGNAYFSPGGIGNLAGGLFAASCKDAGNPTPLVLGTGAPPCKAQGPSTFNGFTGYYPHVVRAAP